MQKLAQIWDQFLKEYMTEKWNTVMPPNYPHKIVHSSALYYQNLKVICEPSKKIINDHVFFCVIRKMQLLILRSEFESGRKKNGLHTEFVAWSFKLQKVAALIDGIWRRECIIYDYHRCFIVLLPMRDQ